MFFQSVTKRVHVSALSAFRHFVTVITYMTSLLLCVLFQDIHVGSQQHG